MFRVCLAGAESKFGHGEEHVENGCVFAEDADGTQRVDVNGARPARLITHKSGEECASAMVKGDVVRMRRNTIFIKCDDDVNIGCGLCRVVGSLSRKLGRKGVAEEACDLGLVPFRRH